MSVRPPRPVLLPGSLVVFALVLAFYLATLAPGVNWADGARMQMDARLGGSSYAYLDELAGLPTDGLPFDRLGAAAWDHPLWVMIAQIFLLLPFQEPAYTLNLMSAFFGALAAAAVFVVGAGLSGSYPAAFAGALALAVSHTFWFHAVTTEVYTLHLLLMALQIGLALRLRNTCRPGDLLLSAFVAGLGIANHRLFALTPALAAAYLLLDRRKAGYQPAVPEAARVGRLRQRWMLAPGIFVSFLLGLAPYWIQFVRMARLTGPGLALRLAFTASLIERRLAVDSIEALAGNLGVYTAWLLYQYLPVGVGLGIWGFIRLFRSRPLEAAFLLALLAAYTAFSANFSIADQFSHHLSSFLVFELGLVCGIAALSRRILAFAGNHLPWRVFTFWGTLLLLLAVLPVLVYAAAPRVLTGMGLTEARLGIYPVGLGARNTLAYFLNPNKRGDNSAARFGRDTLTRLPPGAVVFTPKTSEQETYVVLRYFQKVDGLRPDVRLEMMLFDPLDSMPTAVLARAVRLAPCRPLYFASRNPASFPVGEIGAYFQLEPEANLYRLLPRDSLPVPADCTARALYPTGLSMAELVQRALRWE